MSNQISARRPHRRAAIATAVVLLMIIAAGAAWDPSGLLAPVGGRGLPLMGTGAVYRWAPLLIGLPVLLVGAVLPVAQAARTARSAWWIFVVTWIGAVGAGALGAAATGFAASVPMLGSHLSPGLALGFAAATAGFAAMKFLLVGPLVAAVAALAWRTGPGRTEDGVAPTGTRPAVAAGAANEAPSEQPGIAAVVADESLNARPVAAVAGTGGSRPVATMASAGESPDAGPVVALASTGETPATQPGVARAGTGETPATQPGVASAGTVEASAARPGVARAGTVEASAARPVVAETSTHAAPATRAGTAIAIMFVVVVLGGFGFGARWWRGGPVGYGFGGLLIAPSAAAGIVGFAGGVVAFVGIFAVAVRASLRRFGCGRVAVASAVWVAAIMAGTALGALDAIIAGRPSEAGLANAGPDSWWIATTLLSVATGIGYGASAGPIAAIVTGLTAPRTTRPNASNSANAIGTNAAGMPGRPGPGGPTGGRRARWAVGALVGVLLLALPLIFGGSAIRGPERAAPVAASGGLERLRVLPAADGRTPPTIGDATGRQVLLRGVDVNQLIDYYLRDPAVPATAPLTDADFAQMASTGFDVVRLGLSWSRLEPRRGEFDEDYLRQVETAVAQAKAHGIYTVLDMHEDAWGNALAAPSQACGGGTSPTTGWDGAPAWATITDGTLHCQFMARDLAPAVGAAFGNFYTDRDGIQTELVKTWAFVAKAFADEPAVAGYDLLNEPGIGADPPVSSGLLLGRYYDAAITALRAAERAGGGFPHLVFFEPSVLWSGLGFDVAPPPGFTADRELVFAPHPYSESITMDQGLGLTIASIERNLTMSSRAAAAYGAALWAGEWGWFGDPAVDGAKVARFAAEQDRLGIGGAFWVWRQGCGSPETGADAVTSGNLVGVKCATGEAIAPPEPFARPLSRAYPRAFPGRLDELSSGGSDLRFAATVTGGENCQVDVWIPGEATPAYTTQGVAGATLFKVAGGWELTGCASGRYSVTVG